MNLMILKTRQKYLLPNHIENQIYKIKQKYWTNNGLLEVQTITKQEILINKEIEEKHFSGIQKSAATPKLDCANLAQ